jgi:two-component system, LuxR family, response regulator FixJ
MNLVQPDKLHHFNIHVLNADPHEKQKIGELFSSLALNCQFASQAADLLASPPNATWGCLLLDVRLSFYSALELQQLIKAHDASLPIIFMGEEKDTETAIQALKAGAFDFLLRPLNEQRLLNSVNMAIRQRQTQLQHQDLLKKKQICLNSLSNRESEVLRLLLKGCSNKQMGETLNISVKTIEQHRANVMKKMRADTFAELIKMMTHYELERTNVSFKVGPSHTW